MFVVGTAGHIDHGKSTLVQALTSINPDRLPEEQKRGMTIDLGFAWLDLHGFETVGVIDVPGHERLVKTMIAGAAGIDAAILVIAADDGWMPQTDEHFRILELLGLPGVVALTKVDLVEPDWCDLVAEDIRDHLRVRGVREWQIVKVSSRTGQGLDELKAAIVDVLRALPPKRDVGKARLAVDRVFTVKGSGTVVTGTLTDGSLRVGDQVLVFPSLLKPRIRNLQSYKTPVTVAYPGNRVAANLVGLERSEIRRGDVICREGQVSASRLLDVHIRIIPGIDWVLKSGMELGFYHGTLEAIARISLLGGRQALLPGENCFAQLRFNSPVMTRVWDRFILRQPADGLTVGGGIVLDPVPGHRHKTTKLETVAQLERRLHASLDDLVLLELGKQRIAKATQFLQATPYADEEIRKATARLAEKALLRRSAECLISIDYWQQKTNGFLDMLKTEHVAHPLLRGLGLKEAQARLRIPDDVFQVLTEELEKSGRVRVEQGFVALSDHTPRLTERQQEVADAIVAEVVRRRENPPTKKEILAQYPEAEPILHFLCCANKLVALGDGIVIEAAQFQVIVSKITAFLRQNGTINVQQVRELLGFSRKYILPILARMDEEGLTRRTGDERILIQRQGGVRDANAQ